MLQGLASAGTESTSSALGMYAGYRIGQKTDKQAFERQVWLARNAHQMEVDDLRAAGLNPILSAGGGGAHASPVTSNTATSTMTGAEAGRKIGASYRGMEWSETASRIAANMAASARDISTAETNAEAAKEIKARRLTDYGSYIDESESSSRKNEKGEEVVTPFKGLKREEWATRKENLDAEREILNQRARALGFENVEAAQEAKIWEAGGGWFKALQMLVNGLRGGAGAYSDMRKAGKQ